MAVGSSAAQIDLPQICVLGSQSSGKSSVLEVSYMSAAAISTCTLNCLIICRTLWGAISFLEGPVLSLDDR